MLFKRIVPALCLLSVASAQIRGLSSLHDPKSVEVKECEAKSGVDFNSQYREDESVIEHFFKNKCGGTVVEMGGYDGKTYSNSWYFQYALGWRTLLVEAFPENFEKMVRNRPEATNVFGAMCLGESIEFQVGKHGATGGVAQDMSDVHKQHWTTGETGVIQVPCMQVTKLFLEKKIDHVDVFFLDVEGGELAVLQTIDWGKVDIDMFVVEMDGSNLLKDEAVRAVLRAHGYVTPFNMLEECRKKQEQCMPSELFVLKEVLEKNEIRIASN